MLCRLRAAVVLGLSACVIVVAGGAEPPAPEATSPPSRPPAVDPAVPQAKDASPRAAREPGPFDAQILEAARVFRSEFTRVSDYAAWALVLCTAYIDLTFGPSLWQSQSKDSSTHGKKLYYLYAKDAADYSKVPTVAESTDDADAATPWKAAVGQTLVKQSFVPERVPLDSVPVAPQRNPFEGVAQVDHTRDASGAIYQTGEPAGLFLMLKMDPATPGTDDGWVYATTTPDAKSILSAGLIESCMKCHQHKTSDRLFGPQRRVDLLLPSPASR